MFSKNIITNLVVRNCRRSSKARRMTSTYVWIDLEMTGLDPAKDKILEVACILTDSELQAVDEGISFVINQPNDTLDAMNSWCKVQHLQSGLTEACRNSKVSLSEAEEQVANYIKHHARGHSYLAGNSVYMDMLFLMHYMPKVNSLLHYRILDVSTIKLLCNDWFPEVFSKLNVKKRNHRALDDIRESIEELKQYRSEIFKRK